MVNFDISIPTLVPPVIAKQCTHQDGIELCKILYDKLSPIGFYPALTGGLIYKDGPRKDIDIVIFRNRQEHDGFETAQLFDELASVGVDIIDTFGFVTKAEWKGFTIDLFNPESEYETEKYAGES